MLKSIHIYVVEVIKSIALLTTMLVSHSLKILDQLPVLDQFYDCNMRS